MKNLKNLALAGLLVLTVGTGFKTWANGGNRDGLVKLIKGGSVLIKNQNKLFDALAECGLQVDFKKFNCEDGKTYEFDVTQDGRRLAVGLNEID